jgi:hypothetical protein
MKRLGLKVIDAPYKEGSAADYTPMVVFGKPSHPDVQLAVDVAIGKHGGKTAVLCHVSITEDDSDRTTKSRLKKRGQ